MSSKKPGFGLTTLNRIAKALAETKDLKEVKALRDKAEAARTYIQRAALGQQIQNQAAEMKLRAERRAGEILNEMAPHGGNRRSSRHDGDLKLSVLGINSGQSSRWRREAAVPENVFEQYIAKANELGKDISSQGLLRIARTITAQEVSDFQPIKTRRNSHSANGKRKRSRKKSKSAGSLADEVLEVLPRSRAFTECDLTIEPPSEILQELDDHRDLLTKILGPLLDRDGATLDQAERRMVQRLLADIQQLVGKLRQELHKRPLR